MMQYELIRKTRVLKAHGRLTLTGTARSYLIMKGQVRVLAQKGNGRLQPLFTCGPGDALISSGELDTDWQLLVMGLPEASLAPLDLATLREQAQVTKPTGAVILLLENWISRLVAATCPEAEQAATPFVPERNGHFVGREGGLYVLRRRFAWLKLSEPAVLWGRSVEGVVPWPAHLVLRCDSETSGMVVSSAEALREADAWRQLETIEMDCFAWLEGRLESHRRVQARREAELRSLEGQVRDVFSSSRWLTRPTDGQGASFNSFSSSLVSALTAVCREVGARFRPPPLGVLSAARDPLALCSRSSGFGYRRVNLDARWYEEDIGPLLCRLSDDRRRWVALIRHRGGYRLHETAYGAGVPIDETIDRQIDQSYQLYAGLPSSRLLSFLLFRQGSAVFLGVLLSAILGVVSLLPIFVLEFFRGEGHDFTADTVPGVLLWALLLWAAGLGFLGVFSERVVGRIVSSMNGRLAAAVFHRLLTGSKRTGHPDLPAKNSGLALELIAAEDKMLQAVFGVGSGVGLLAAGLGSLAILNLSAAFGCVAVCAVIAVLFGISLRNSSGAMAVLRVGQAELNSLSASLVGAVSTLRASGVSKRAALIWAVQDAGLQYWRREVVRGLLFRRRLIVLGIASISVVCLLVGDVQEWAHNPLGVPTVGVTMGLICVGVIVIGSSSSDLAGLLNLVGDVRELASEEFMPGGTGVIPDGPSGFIEVDDLSYSADQSQGALIDQVSFTVERGSFVAVVGPSGSGKSTLLRLLLGLAQADSGSIRFDGVDISTLDLVTLREMSGVVLQSLSLPKGSIQSIVSGGRNLSKEQVLVALRSVGLESLVSSLPMGINTLISGNSGVLSGGQMQLLLLARAIAGAPRLVVLDEATSALDNQSQAQAMRAIEALDATRVVVAHRLSTVRNADHIIVLDQGRIVQEGTFEDLQEQDGVFRQLVESQLEEASPDA